LKWYVIAVAYHALTNFILVLIAQNLGVVLSEVIFTFTLFINLAIIRYLKPRSETAA